jgi:hypothetical protein
MKCDDKTNFGGDEKLISSVVHMIHNKIGTKPSKDNRVYSTNLNACQHSHMTSSGIIGMKIVTTSPFFTPCDSMAWQTSFITSI